VLAKCYGATSRETQAISRSKKAGKNPHEQGRGKVEIPQEAFLRSASRQEVRA